jgi:hypothetical protein
MVIIKARRPPDPGPDRSMVRWTRAVGVFTAVLALVAALQFWAFVQSERAFLSVPSMAFEGGVLPQAGDPSPLVMLQLRNGGRSTAVFDRLVFNQAYGPRQPMSQKLEYKEAQSQLSAPSPIPAGATIPVRDHLDMFTQEDIGAIKTGKNRLALFGYISYTDAFWLFGNRATGYCFTYSPTESQWITCPERAYTYVR